MEIVARSSPDHPLVDRPKNRQKSRITNGSALLPGVDGRNVWVRRCKDVIADHLSDLGGMDNTSAAERSIIRRASTLTVELERLEAKFALAGEANAEDLDIYARVASNLRRLLEAVGLQRRSKEVETLAEYLARHEPGKAVDEAYDEPSIGEGPDNEAVTGEYSNGSE
jgi:hypothetical protein